MRPIRSVLGVLLVAAVSSTGCMGAGRRPEPAQPANPPAPTQANSFNFGPRQEGSVGYPSPRAGSAYDSPSQGVATIASAVPAAGRVHAVVLGNVALLGVPNNDAAVHKRIAQQVHASFPHIIEVRVVTDPASINRLGEMQDRIATQQSIAPYLTELATMSGGPAPGR